MIVMKAMNITSMKGARKQVWGSRGGSIHCGVVEPVHLEVEDGRYDTKEGRQCQVAESCS